MTDAPLAPAPPGISADDWRAACAAVRNYCGWHISPEVTETVTVDGSGSSTQLLPTLHLVDLTSIVCDGTVVDDPEWSEMGAVRGACSSRFRGVVATITHGYRECPDEVITVAKALAAVGAPRLARREGTGPFSVEWTDAAIAGNIGVPETAVAILDRYRLPA